MDQITKKISEFVKSTKLDQEDLELFSLRVSKDPKKSRLNVVISSELGVDFPGDTLENLIPLAYNTVSSVISSSGK